VLLELTVAEQRFNAVMEVLRDGLTVIEVAERYGVSRQTVHSWLRRYRTGGLPQARASCSTSHNPRPPGAFGSEATARSSRWLPSRTAMWSQLVPGQRLAGWLATVAKIVAHTGSRWSTPDRSQTRRSPSSTCDSTQPRSLGDRSEVSRWSLGTGPG